jgi:hypothetical protein
MYTAILFETDNGKSGKGLVISRQVDAVDKENIVCFMMNEARIYRTNNIDTVLVLENGKDGKGPIVICHWTKFESDNMGEKENF